MPDAKTGTPRNTLRIIVLSICFCTVLFSSILLGQPRGCLGMIWRSEMSENPSDHECGICGRPAITSVLYEGKNKLWLCTSCKAPERVSSDRAGHHHRNPFSWLLLALPIIIHIVGVIFFGYLLNEAIHSPATAGQPMGHGAAGITLLVVFAVAGNLFCFFFAGG